MAQNSISGELNDLLITHDFDVDALSTKTGKPAVNDRGIPDASEADMFKFDWVGPTGKNYGTAVILLDQNGGLTMYFGDNLGRTMDPEDKKAWYGDSETDSPGFLEQLKNFAIRTSKIRGGFGLENLSKLKYAIAGQAALTESFYGTRKVSYSGAPTDARLMIKHSRPITEGDKRYRYVESLFIETVEGECFRLPFRKLAGGRAMLEHVRQGGKPYDLRGQHIAETVNQLNVLSQFRRAHQGRVFEGAAGDLVTETDQYYQRLTHNLKHMASSRGYSRYFESWKPADISEGDIMVEDLRGMFVETRIDPRIESALPMLAKIQQEAKAMKEADIFESWAARLVEGTWALPDTPEKMTELKTWMSEPHPLGPDAEDVTDVLYELIGDDSLFDQLEGMAEEDATMDAVPIVQAWITRNQDLSPTLAELAMSFQTEEPPAVEDPPAVDAPTAPAQPPVAEGDNLQTFEDIIRLSGALVKESVLTDDTRHTLKHIIRTFKRDVRDFIDNGDMSDDLFDALYDYYFDDMPYGTKKARDGDPHEWVGDRFYQDLNDHGIDEGQYPVEEASYMNPEVVDLTSDNEIARAHELLKQYTNGKADFAANNRQLLARMTGQDKTGAAPGSVTSFRTPGAAHVDQGGYDYSDESPDQSDAETARLARSGTPEMPNDRRMNDADWIMSQNPEEPKGQAHAGQGGYDYNDELDQSYSDQSNAETSRLGRYEDELARIKSLSSLK
jgi:hypothetical protein